jgi:hypothetical protein
MAEGDPTAARRQLEQRGFAVVKGALPAKLIAELRSVIEDPSSNAGVGSISAEHAWNDRYQGDHLFIGFSESDMERDGATSTTSSPGSSGRRAWPRRSSVRGSRSCHSSGRAA